MAWPYIVGWPATPKIKFNSTLQIMNFLWNMFIWVFELGKFDVVLTDHRQILYRIKFDSDWSVQRRIPKAQTPK